MALIPSQVMNVPHHTDSKFKHRQMKDGTGRVRTNQEPKAALTWSSGFLVHSFFSQRGQDDNMYSQSWCTNQVCLTFTENCSRKAVRAMCFLNK